MFQRKSNSQIQNDKKKKVLEAVFLDFESSITFLVGVFFFPPLVQVEFKRNNFFPSLLHIFSSNIYRLSVRSPVLWYLQTPNNRLLRRQQCRLFTKHGESALSRISGVGVLVHRGSVSPKMVTRRPHGGDPWQLRINLCKDLGEVR